MRLTRPTHPIRTAARVLRAHPRLLLLAALAGAVLAAVVAGAVLSALSAPAAPLGGAGVTGGVGGFLVLCAATFLSAVLICAADDAASGRPVTVGGAVARAVRRWPAILAWALLGSLLAAAGALLDRIPVVGYLLEQVFGVALGLLSYLVLPAMMIDGLGVLAALRQARGLVRSTGGRQVRWVAWLSVPVVAAALPAAVALMLAAESDSHPITVLALSGAAVWLALVATVATSLSSVFRTLLYRDSSRAGVPAAA